MEINIREPAVAGQFYPENKEELETAVDELLGKSLGISALKRRSGKLRAIIVPHAGYTYSGSVAAAGFNLINIKYFSKHPKIVLIGPSHNAEFNGMAVASYPQWKTPLGNIPVQNDIILKMSRRFPELVNVIDEAFEDEHCLEVELPFMQRLLGNFSILPFLTGMGNTLEFAEVFNTIEKETDLFVVSTDLSHYYPYEITVKMDKRANIAIPNLDIETFAEEVEACGKTGVLSLMHVAEKHHWKGVLVDYKNSGDAGGDRESAVGYGCYAFYE